jgi:hypothetical protein
MYQERPPSGLERASSLQGQPLSDLCDRGSSPNFIYGQNVP